MIKCYSRSPICGGPSWTAEIRLANSSRMFGNDQSMILFFDKSGK